MLIRAHQPFQLFGNQDEAFRVEANHVYEIDNDYGQRLVQDYGPNRRFPQREPLIFTRVDRPGDQITIMRDGVAEPHIVTEEEAYSGPVHQITADGIDAAEGVPGDGPEPWPAGGGAHLSDSEPPHRPPYADEGATLEQKDDSLVTPTGPQTVIGDPALGNPTGSPEDPAKQGGDFTPPSTVPSTTPDVTEPQG